MKTFKALILFGSESDAAISTPLIDALSDKGIAFDFRVCSAHKSPALLDTLLEGVEKDYSIIIAGAGLAAHLPGVIASKTILPVIGLPVNAAFEGIDALLAIQQMPKGVPVLAAGVDAWAEVARNLTLLARAAQSGEFDRVKITNGELAPERLAALTQILDRFQIPHEEIRSLSPAPCARAINIVFTSPEIEYHPPDHCLSIMVPIIKPTLLHLSWLLQSTQKGLWVGTNRADNAALAAVALLGAVQGGSYQHELWEYREDLAAPFMSQEQRDQHTKEASISASH